MGRKRRQPTSKRELVIGMIGPLAIASALGIGLVWWQQSGGVELSLSGAKASSSRSPDADRMNHTPGPVPGAAQASAGEVTPAPPPVPTAATPGFRTVCCKRPHVTPYWTAAEWCADVGKTVEDRLCELQLPEPGLVLASANPAGRSEGAAAAHAVTYTECLRLGGDGAFDARCALLLERVCCQQQGRVFETARGECQELPKTREIETRACEPVCCQRGDAPATLWESRANCGGPGDLRASVVEEERCEEVCCEMSDHAMRRDSRRACNARGGNARPTSVCAARLAAQRPAASVDTERANLIEEDRSKVDVEVRLPAASPYL